jgi:hypothetical protein
LQEFEPQCGEPRARLLSYGLSSDCISPGADIVPLKMRCARCDKMCVRGEIAVADKATGVFSEPECASVVSPP